MKNEKYQFNGTTKTTKIQTDEDGNIIQKDETLEAHWLENGKSLDQLKEEADEIIRKAKDSYNCPDHTIMANSPSGQCKLSQVVTVKISTNGNPDIVPQYKTNGAAGMDVYANIQEPITLKPLERVLVPTGIYVEIPEDYEFQLRPRSGLALKKGLTLLNAVGTIDSDYRLEIGAIMVNLSNENVTIEPMERIAQLVLAKVEKCSWNFCENSDDFSKTDRQGGYGSTGLL